MRVFLLLMLSSTMLFAQQIEVPLKKPCPYGYLEFKPPGARALIISLHGMGKRGNGTTELYRASEEGLARLIRDNKWNRTEFIVISPQLAEGQKMYSYKGLHPFVIQMIEKYKPDTSQIYMVGLSAGANSIYPYISKYKDIKAVVCVSGSGDPKSAYKAINTRLWAFHGDLDKTVKIGPDINYNKAYNLAAGDRPKARLTIYPGVAHSGWQQTFTGEWFSKWFSKETPETNIYDWLLSK